MADNDKRSDDPSVVEASDRGKAGKHDPFDRVDVSGQPGQVSRNLEGKDDFGFISQELATDELETPEPEVDDEDKG